MQLGRTTLSKFLIEQLDGVPDAAGGHGQLAALLVDVAAAIKSITAMTAKGSLRPLREPAQAEALEDEASEELIRSCDWSGLTAGMLSRRSAAPYDIPAEYKRGRHLLTFDPLGDAVNADLNVPVGTLFSITPHAPDTPPQRRDWLRPGRHQVAAGYALYGPATVLVLTVGRGTHGFTLDREVGNFILTHPSLRVPEDTGRLAINASNERFWEPPVRRYVDECKAGATAVRGRDFSMRWIASTVADVHRILLRGGVFMTPRSASDPTRPGQVHLLHEANPIALLVEQAGGVASTGRGRILDVEPQELHEQTPLFLGSRNEIERIERYHKEFDEGTDRPYVSPLFNERSLYRDTADHRH